MSNDHALVARRGFFLSALGLAALRAESAQAATSPAPTYFPAKGRPGVEYAVISAVIRNYGAPNYWQPIEYQTPNGARYHNMTGLDPTTPVEMTSDNKIQINYSALGATAVSSLNVTHDNDMVYAGVTCGVSVQTNLAIITIARFAPYVDYLYWSGTKWTFARGAYSPFTIESFSSDGTLVIGHPDLGSTGGYNGGGTNAWSQVSLTGRGIYRPVISAHPAALAYTSFAMQFLDQQDQPVLTPNVNCRVSIQRGGGQDFSNSLDARLVGLGASSGENIWISGLLEVPA